MRTKTTVLTAALVAAGALSSMAQNVYSVNVVGYINVTLKPGYNLIANQLDNTSNNINNVLTNVLGGVPDNTTIQKWNPSVQDFAQSDQYINGLGWVDNSYAPSTTTFSPGEGAFVFNPNATNLTMTFVGQVIQGTNKVVLGPGYNFVSDLAPVSSGFSTNGFPILAENSTFQTFVNGDYSQALLYIGGLGWVDTGYSPSDPTPAVSQGFVIFNAGTSNNWTRSFIVQ